MTASTGPVDRGYLDVERPLADRVELLLSQMTLEEKAGQMFHTMAMPAAGGEIVEGVGAFGLPSVVELISQKAMSHFNVLGSAGSPSALARWHNALQVLAGDTRLGIPVTLSTDPRHSFTDNPGTAAMAGAFSQWPEPLGLAAIGDEVLVEDFAEHARREYLAVGLRVALHPQIDLATEPRWARQAGTFGEDPELTGRLAAAYIRGFQGSDLGTRSVATMVKHFPGAGPQKDGEDAHFAYGREQVYPGGRADLHLRPFEAAFSARASQVMPYYGMPVGTEWDEVGFGFNKSVVTGLLRERYSFDGIVCTDWGLLSDGHLAGEVHPARAWGVEHLSVSERMMVAIEAGVDQFGGEHIPEILVDLVRGGFVTEDRIDVSVRRLLREKFVLGLFDDRYVDADAAESVVGSPEARRAGEDAQRRSLTILTNRMSEQDGVERPTLPARRGIRIYCEGIDLAVAAEYGVVSEDPSAADLAIVRLHAPFDDRPGVFERFFHAGSLEFPAPTISHVQEIAALVPTVVDVFLDRPAILTSFVDDAGALIANFGADARALLDVVFAASPGGGRLPFDLPRSMASVEASREDVPFDTADPLFRFGHGLTI